MFSVVLSKHPAIMKNDFVSLLGQTLPKKETNSLIECINAGDSPVSIRVNRKKINEGLKLKAENGSVSHCGDGFFLKERPLFTADPLLHAGFYYVQEANSMWIGEVARWILGASAEGISPEKKSQEKKMAAKGRVVLDLCAAPGGKSTHLSSVLGEGDQLVANEIISVRNSILFENVSKWGDGNTLITKADAKEFGKLDSVFDLISCDAPCSGEGLFRKDDLAQNEWSLEHVDLCAQRQQRIVFDVWDALKPGGYFIYSTCTYNRKENEDNVLRFCEELGADLIELPSDMDGREFLYEVEPKMYRCMPHLSQGEGLFFAILRKHGVAEEVRTSFRLPGMVHEKTPIGEVFHGKWKPHPAAALLNSLSRGDLFKNVPTVELSDEEVMLYLRREFIPLKTKELGAVLLTWKGFNMGTANAVKNGLNNLLPMEWRVRSQFSASSIFVL